MCEIDWEVLGMMLFATSLMFESSASTALVIMGVIGLWFLIFLIRLLPFHLQLAAAK